MKLSPRLLTTLAIVAVAALLVAACGDDTGTSDEGVCAGQNNGLHGTDLCFKGSGQQPIGSFVVAGGYDVKVVGGNIGSDNTTIRVFQLEQSGNGFSTKLVGTTGPKAVVPGIQVRPGDTVDVHFDFGPGEFYIIVQTDTANNWTAIISPVSSLPAG